MISNIVFTNMTSFRLFYLPKASEVNKIAEMTPSELGVHMAKETIKSIKYNQKGD